MTTAGDRRRRHASGAPARRSADWAWLAAAVEGEGSVRLVGGCQVIEVTNTDSRFLQRCAEIVGAGKLRRVHNPRESRPCWRWAVYGANARRVCQLTRPYLITKGEQVDVLLDLVMPGKGRRLTPAQHADRRRADERLKELRHNPPGQ